MKTIGVSLPELAFVAATRGLAGAGIGLLLSVTLSAHQRRTVGWTLLAIGVLTTLPIALEVLTRTGVVRSHDTDA